MDILIPAIIQGITEFLPVSSSTHLYLWNYLIQAPPSDFPYEMILNAGTLLATILYFRVDLFHMVKDVLKQCAGKGSTEYSRLAWLLVLSTIPVCLVGFLLHDFIETHLRSFVWMGVMMMLFGALLGLSDRQKQQTGDYRSITVMQALYIGLGQIFSLIPGASRSGTTITVARFLGLNRELSVRYSFLLAIPVTLAAVSLSLMKSIGTPFDWFNVLLGFVVSAVVGLLCIHLLLTLIIRMGFLPFAIYRLILGVGLVYYFW